MFVTSVVIIDLLMHICVYTSSYTYYISGITIWQLHLNKVVKTKIKYNICYEAKEAIIHMKMWTL